MIIYNVTVKIDGMFAEQWLDWLLEEHIPEMMATGCFTRYQVVRVLEQDDTEGPTYAIQYYAESRSDYNRYIEIFSDEMRGKGQRKWGDRFMAFRTVMEVVK